MSADLRPNGCDTLMLGFDYDLRRRGFAGNSCQIVLHLNRPVDPAALIRRLDDLTARHPTLCAKPVRGWNWAQRWKPVKHRPSVRVHSPSPDLDQRLFNERLTLSKGQLFRFDVCGCDLYFTWTHALMDAKSAEYFLALVGGDSVEEPGSGQDWYGQRAVVAGDVKARIRLARRELNRLNGFRQALPISLATQRPPTRTELHYRVERFSAEESSLIQANAAQRCGFLGETNFHLAAALYVLHRLHDKMGCASASYVLPVPISLRPKGEKGPLFSNQITTLLHQFLPGQAQTLAAAVTAVRSRNNEYLRDEHINPGIALGQLSRCFPRPIYMWLVKQALRGEICSLFFGDTAGVEPRLQTFFGAAITGFAHVPAVTVPPGIGVVFYSYQGCLQFTFVHAEGTLSEPEADYFCATLRATLLTA